jgi:hypothetical protein
VSKRKHFPSFQMLSACWAIEKIRMSFTVGGAPVAVKSRAVKASSSLKNTLYYIFTRRFRVSLISLFRLFVRNRDSSDNMTTGYGLDGRGSTTGWGKNILSIPQRPDRFWGPSSLLPNGYRELFPRR